MNQNRLAAYDTHQRQDENVRITEAHALLSCASKLEAARQEGASSDSFGEALRHNQELWTLFQACICEEDNPLPRDLKILLLNLSRYVDKTTFRALSTKDVNALNSLISINRTIATGLRMGADAPTTTAQPAAPDPQTHTPIITSA